MMPGFYLPIALPARVASLSAFMGMSFGAIGAERRTSNHLDMGALYWLDELRKPAIFMKTQSCNSYTLLPSDGKIRLC